MPERATTERARGMRMGETRKRSWLAFLLVPLACSGLLLSGGCHPSPSPNPQPNPVSPKDPRKAQAKQADCEPRRCRFAAQVAVLDPPLA